MIVTGVDIATGVVVIVNRAEDVAPCGIVMLAGTVAAGFEAVSRTTAQPEGAGPFKITWFDAALEPPNTEAGDITTELSAAAWTVTLEMTNEVFDRIELSLDALVREFDLASHLRRG